MRHSTVVLAGSLADIHMRLAHAVGQDGSGAYTILALRRDAEALSHSKIIFVTGRYMTNLLNGTSRPVRLIELPSAECELSTEGLLELRAAVDARNHASKERESVDH